MIQHCTLILHKLYDCNVMFDAEYHCIAMFSGFLIVGSAFFYYKFILHFFVSTTPSINLLLIV